MPYKQVSKEALIGVTIVFDNDTDDQIDQIEKSFAMNHIDIISLDVDGVPVTPTSGSFDIFVKTDVDGGFKQISERSNFNAKLTGGSRLADGVAVDAKHVGFPLEFKIVPNGVDVAISYRVDIKQSSAQIDRTTPLETSDRGNVGVPVFNLDQTTPPLSVPFLRERSTTSLAVDAVIDSRTVELTGGHGALVGDILELADVESGIFLQSRILIVAVNDITLDQPVNFEYSTTDVVVLSSDDMIIDGSVTPQIFSILPLLTQSGDMVRAIWQIENIGNDMDFSTFGGAPALINGCVLRVKNSDGTFRNIMDFKTNGDILNQAFDHAFLNPRQGNTVRGFASRLTWGGQSKHGVVIRLDGGVGEELQVVIQDDLTVVASAAANDIFRMRTQGHELQG